MNVTLYKMKIAVKNTVINTWYWMMKPIAFFFTSEKVNKRYKEKQSKITEEQAKKWIAEDIVRYLIKHKSDIEILICDYANEDHFWSDCTLKKCPYYFKREKTKMAYYKFNMDIDFQEKIIEYVKTLNAVKVIERVEEFTWQRIDNYKKTVIILP